MSITNFWAKVKHYFVGLQKIKEININFKKSSKNTFEKMQSILEFDRNASIKLVRYTGNTFEIEFFERRRSEEIEVSRIAAKKKADEKIKILRQEEDAIAELAITNPSDYEDAVLNRDLMPREEEREY